MPTDVNCVQTNPNTQLVAVAADAPLYDKSALGHAFINLEEQQPYLARIASEFTSA